MKIKSRHLINGFSALSVTRKNAKQRCVYCCKDMPKGTLGIVLRKGLTKQDYFVWCHLECFPKLSEEINVWIKNNQELIKRVRHKVMVDKI